MDLFDFAWICMGYGICVRISVRMDDDVYFGFDAWICLLLTRPSD